MPSRLPIPPLELEKLMADPAILLRRLVLSFALERPKQMIVPRKRASRPPADEKR